MLIRKSRQYGKRKHEERCIGVGELSAWWYVGEKAVVYPAMQVDVIDLLRSVGIVDSAGDVEHGEIGSQVRSESGLPSVTRREGHDKRNQIDPQQDAAH